MINWKIADPKNFAPFPGSNCTHLRVFKDPSLAHVHTRTPVRTRDTVFCIYAYGVCTHMCLNGNDDVIHIGQCTYVA